MSEEPSGPSKVQLKNELSLISTLTKRGNFKAILENYRLFEDNLELKDMEGGGGNKRIIAIKKYVESIPSAFENHIQNKFDDFGLGMSLDDEIFKDKISEYLNEFKENSKSREGLDDLYKNIRKEQGALDDTKLKNTEYFNEIVDYFRGFVKKLNKPEEGFKKLYDYRGKIMVEISNKVKEFSKKPYFIKEKIKSFDFAKKTLSEFKSALDFYLSSK